MSSCTTRTSASAGRRARNGCAEGRGARFVETTTFEGDRGASSALTGRAGRGEGRGRRGGGDVSDARGEEVVGRRRNTGSCGQAFLAARRVAGRVGSDRACCAEYMDNQVADRVGARAFAARALERADWAWWEEREAW